MTRARHRGGGFGAALVGALLLALAPVPAGAETLTQAYGRALKAYYAGHYKQAIATMERVLAVPTEHPDLHYNLGVAYYAAGKLGPAIYHFERALKLDPGAEDARFNLRVARQQAARRVTDELKGASAPPLWHRVVTWLSPMVWAVLFLSAWWSIFALLLARRRVSDGPVRSGLVAAAGLMAVVALFSGVLLLGRGYYDQHVIQGVVLPDKLAVREGPGSDTKSTFALHAGFKVRILGRQGDWARIRLQNGLEGWAPGKALGQL